MKPKSIHSQYQFVAILCLLITSSRSAALINNALLLHSRDYYSNQKQQKVSREKLLKSKLFARIKEIMEIESSIDENPYRKAASEYYTAPQDVAGNYYHVSLGRGTRVRCDDESTCDQAAVNLGMFSRNLPSNQYG